jgi:hypothetical protein
MKDEGAAPVANLSRQLNRLTISESDLWLFFNSFYMKNSSEKSNSFNEMINDDDKYGFLYKISIVKLWDPYFYDWFLRNYTFKQESLIHVELYNKLAKQVLKDIC